MATTLDAPTLAEGIAANVQFLIEQLEAGHSQDSTASLTATGQFHSYFFGNIFEIARQKPDIILVAASCMESARTQGDKESPCGDGLMQTVSTSSREPEAGTPASHLRLKTRSICRL